MKLPLLQALALVMFFSTITHAAGPAKPQNLLNHIDWNFVQNRGQLTDENGQPQTDISYYGHQGGVYLYCRPGRLSFVFTKEEKDKSQQDISEATGAPVETGHVETGHALSLRAQIPTKITTCRADLILLNANPSATITAEDQQAYYENFYTAYTGEQGITNVHTYKTIVYHDVYPHIDMVLHAKPQGMKYEFVVHAQGNVSDIQIKWDGLQNMAADRQNNIEYATALGWMKESPVISLQNEKKIESQCIISGRTLKYTISNYNKNTDLIIDPSLLWSTYYSGGSESIADVATNDKDNVYICGNTVSTGGIATSGSFQTNLPGTLSAFMARFDSRGRRLWGTYFGGNISTEGQKIRPDNFGYLYLSGNTGSSSGIATSGSYQTYLNGGNTSVNDAFLAKFDTSGVRKWATYFGGSKSESLNGMAVDAKANIYITGLTSSTGNIATSGAYQTSLGGAADAFIADFDSSGKIQWSTYFGGSYGDYPSDIFISKGGNISLAFNTGSSGLATSGAYQTTPGPMAIAGFSSSGALKWCSYYGSFSLSVTPQLGKFYDDQHGSFYILGQAGSNGMATGGAYQTKIAGGNDLFLTKFDSLGKPLWATYYGGKNDEAPAAISTDNAGNLLIAGNTRTDSGLAMKGAYQYKSAGLDEGFIAGFSSAGKYLWSTYFGGPKFDVITCNAVDKAGRLYFAGNTESTTGIATYGAFKTRFTSSSISQTGFLACFNTVTYDAAITSAVSPVKPVCEGKTSVSVVLKNYGTHDLDSVKIGIAIGKKKYTPITWKGKLLEDSSATVNLGSYQFPAGKDTIKVWSYLPDNNTDSVTNNDTLTFIDSIIKPPVPNPGVSGEICLGQSYNIGNSKAFGNNFSWKSLPSGYTSSSASDVVSPSATTTYILTETVPNYGCSNKDSITISVNPLPKAAFAINTYSSCLSGNKFSFFDSSSISSGSVVRWAWSFGDKTTDTVQNPVHSYAAAAAYKITLKATSNKGCVSANTASNAVLLNPQSKIALKVNGINPCIKGNLMSVTDNTTVPGGLVIAWHYDLGDNDTDNVQNPVHSYKKPGTYKVSLKVVNNYGCIDTGSLYTTVYRSPVAAFGVNNYGQCLNTNTFSFHDSSDAAPGKVTQWNWGFDNYSILDQNPDFQYNTSGVKNVKLIIKTSLGCSDTIVKKVTVFPLPQKNISVNKSAQCFKNNSFVFTDNSTISSGTILSRQWTFGNGDTSSAKTKTLSYPAGQYMASLVLQTDKGCKDTVKQTITVYPAITARAYIDKTQACLAGNSFMLTDSSGISGDSVAARIWDFGDKTISKDKTTSHSYLKAGSYSIRLISTSQHGCSDTVNTPLTVFAMPHPSVTSDTIGCRGKIFLAATPSAAGNKYKWTLTNGAVNGADSVSSISIQWPDTTSAIIKVLETSVNGCKDSSVKRLNLYKAPIARFAVDARVCAGSPLAFTDSSTGASAWHWSFGDTAAADSANQVHTFLSAGLYHTSLRIVSARGCADTAVKDIVVNPLPDASWFITYSGQATYLHARDSSLSADAYHWILGDGDTASGHTPVHIYPKNKSYLVKLNVKSNFGCMNEHDSTVKIRFSGIENNDENAISALTIYPNPFSTSTTLQYSLLKPSLVHIELLDITGKTIAQITDAQQGAGIYRADVAAELKSGIYLLKFTVNNETLTRQLIKF